MRPVLVPVLRPMDIRAANVFEHTPLSYYIYGEYPRFIRPVGAHRPEVRVEWVREVNKKLSGGLR